MKSLTIVLFVLSVIFSTHTRSQESLSPDDMGKAPTKNLTEWRSESNKVERKIESIYTLKDLQETAFIEDSQSCRSTRISELATNKNLYEILKENKTEGIFYTFDDELDLIHTLEKRKNQNNITINIMKTYICQDKKLILVETQSCITQLSQNKLEHSQRVIKIVSQS